MFRSDVLMGLLAFRHNLSRWSLRRGETGFGFGILFGLGGGNGSGFLLRSTRRPGSLSGSDRGSNVDFGRGRSGRLLGDLCLSGSGRGSGADFFFLLLETNHQIRITVIKIISNPAIVHQSNDIFQYVMWSE